MSQAHAHASSLGSYEVIRKLGAGGMAEVFLAVQRMAGDVERLVVVKSILPSLAEDERFVQMFMREARIAAMLAHPNIVHIHDVTIIDRRPCIVMEFLRGRDLSFLLRRSAADAVAVDPVAAATVIAEAATGLHYAHTKKDDRGRPLGLVHRDVSPQNIFVTREGHVRVLDFGIAKSARQREQTETGTLKGKLAYMAPEYLEGAAVDGRADEFALGVVLWEALAGKRLFAREEHFQTMTALYHMQVSPPSSVAPGVPAELDDIAMRALSRDPSGRFETCEAMATALRAYLRSADAGSEAQIVAGWIERVAPATEDGDLYGPNPLGLTMTFARQAEATESMSGIVTAARPSPSDGSEVHETETRKLPAAGAAAKAAHATHTLDSPWAVPGVEDLPTRALDRPTPPVTSALPAVASATPITPRGTPWIAIAGAAGALLLALGAGGFVAWRSTTPQADVRPAVAPMPIAIAAPVPPVTPIAPPSPATIEVRFENLPERARVELDGVPVEGARFLGAPSPRARRVRVLDGTRVLADVEQVFDRSMAFVLPQRATVAGARRPGKTRAGRPIERRNPPPLGTGLLPPP